QTYSHLSCPPLQQAVLTPLQLCLFSYSLTCNHILYQNLNIPSPQKAISAPAGLTIVGISQDAKNCIKNRKTDVIGFYCNLNIWEG
ncbi:hypothetical protein ACTPEM_23920, partial [Clostridioides difficile]